MKIINLKVNSYGKLKEKEITFDRLNVIYGKNESGKSTLLQFIISMFYGISKNKNGKEISDYDKYLPWDNDNFSGKLSYMLDDNKSFEVYRDFKKKNPIIYNDQFKDISKEYEISKKEGIPFFFYQTGLSSDMFLSTLVSKQQEVKLDEQSKNTLIQRVANLMGTGDDSVSFKKAMDKLNKKQLDEVGNARSKDKPMNMTLKQIEQINRELKESKLLKESKYSITQRKNQISEDIEKQKEKILVLDKIYNVKESLQKIQEQFIINDTIKEENIRKLVEIDTQKDSLNRELETIKKAQNQDTYTDSLSDSKDVSIHNSTKISLVMLCISLVLLFLNMFVMNDHILKILLPITTGVLGIYLIYSLIKSGRNRSKNKSKAKMGKLEAIESDNNLEIDKQRVNQIQVKIELLDEQINQILESNEKIDDKNSDLKEDLENEKKEKIEKIVQETGINLDNIFDFENIEKNIRKEKELLNQYELDLHKINIEEDNIVPQLEKMVELEESLSVLLERKDSLEDKDKMIEHVKQYLQSAYMSMKETVAPKFTNNISDIVKKISNNKYQKVVLNEENDILIENIDGKYIKAENLSVGTIEQIYLALRLSIIEDISKEKMPIMLDETFAYYDDERLEEVLNFLNEEKKDHQVFIYTCSKRELEILEKNHIDYNLISL